MYCTQLVQMQCTSVYTTHINGKHTDIAHRFVYRYTVHNLYTAVHSCTLPYNLRLPTHTCGAHTMLGSVVLLYVYTVVQSLYT